MEKVGGKATKKISKEILFSPGGMILFFLAVLIEGLDLLPLPFFDQILEVPLEVFYFFLFKIITGVSFSECFRYFLVPFLIERIPLISDILPTFLLRLFF
jgi:hypothetical protein